MYIHIFIIIQFSAKVSEKALPANDISIDMYLHMYTRITSNINLF
jgi:hypothetical protein